MPTDIIALIAMEAVLIAAWAVSTIRHKADRHRWHSRHIPGETGCRKV